MFGICRGKSHLIAVYSTWSALWIAWNTFIVLLYYGVGTLNIDDHKVTLNLGLDKVDNWFSAHPYGCAADLKIEINAADKISEESVTSEPTVNDEWKSCVWHYFYIEIILSSLQIVFAVFGMVLSCLRISQLADEYHKNSLDLEEVNEVKTSGGVNNRNNSTLREPLFSQPQATATVDGL